MIRHIVTHMFIRRHQWPYFFSWNLKLRAVLFIFQSKTDPVLFFFASFHQIKAIQREESYEEQIRDITSRLKDVSWTFDYLHNKASWIMGLTSERISSCFFFLTSSLCLILSINHENKSKLLAIPDSSICR